MCPDFLYFYIDKPKLKADVKKILKQRGMDYNALGMRIGYTTESIRIYFSKRGSSKFITASLLETFNLNPKDYIKEKPNDGSAEVERI